MVVYVGIGKLFWQQWLYFILTPRMKYLRVWLGWQQRAEQGVAIPSPAWLCK